ncbi:uncharacterized protein LOC112567222 isoform X2 [Pomacea canaliculata]|nr:uncharacterized protein LOC112567222 isoform X2 [Pomacea canaliculata]XP_025099618.1 uncharacterized protein LOC112567222 isoform X2 [Pomacea canaliculata]
MTTRRKLEGRQGPKHLEKMLFTNNREEERLQRHLQELNNSSRLRGMELDREKVEVHNEMRLSRRRNSAPSLVIPPADSHAETTAAPESAPVASSLGPKPFARGAGPATSKSRQPAETDPANEYLLTEFKRVSEVIPNILNSLNRPEDKCAAGGDNQKRDNSRWKATLMAAGRRGSLAGVGGGAAPLTTPRLVPDEALTRAGTRETPGEPKIANIVNMIRKIKSLRGDMAANKRAELMRSKTTFKDLLKNIQEEESKGGDCDTYTDGACSLLRRKMYKARRASCPVLDVASVVASEASSITREAILQKRNSAPLPFASLATRPTPVLGRSSSSMALLGRLGSREAEGYRRALLQQEDRELTEMKVATEWRRYDQIRKRIGHFLHDVDNPARRASLPILPDSAVQEVELQDS